MKMNRIAPLTLTAMLVFVGTQLSAQDGSTGSAVVSDSVLLYALVGVASLLVVVNFVLLGTIKGIAGDKKIWEVVKEKANKTNATASALVIGLLFSTSAFAQADAAQADTFVMGSDLFYALLSMNLILLLLIFYQINVLRSLIGMMKGETEEETESVVDTWASALTDVVPIEKEEEIMFEHEHDGIRELDNNLPPWWLWGFYFTIAFGIGYVIYYYGMDGPNQHQEYVMEMEAAEEAKAAYLAGLSNLIDETNVELGLDEATLAEGREIWVANCVACHGDKGEGGVGPNMTDPYWIHGGGIKNVFKTIKYGVPTKGMIPWEAQLSPGQMKSVASYIISLEGTNPPNPKEPQGEIWKDEAAAAPAPAANESDPAAEEEEEKPVEEGQTEE